MARGRKKLPCRDIRSEKIRAAEAVKFLNVEERFFYRLREEGYIQGTGAGDYLLGDVLSGFILACADKRLSLSEFLLGLSEAQAISPEDIDTLEQRQSKREKLQRIHVWA